ncbi:glycosyltransferase, exosortase A system-associated [Pontixanthobacter aestiaquae]|uniref:Glycosyltransferase, exosortase A system-associated n=1 Tax=Pontixanthobacter aestiaquae TaxID=1509367 RepID=A0A844Z8Q5_9SPHN|nr:TIGR04063 family PEP-CTERM/XrtA system glycosyltransferase [Pontixanthobacter aestiaquae]MDN3646728.1 glycosyltransferase, exosortase A system-associated [Pontixanthobacter aestiaquae]MXO82289.1 glycosyltransferase, exosortase A system-associated [Pontixanthobacter aestiaquae]
MTRILHVLDHSLPLHSGYTFRTRAILKSQQAAGMEVRGITGQRHAADGPASEQADGLTFHRTPGEADGPVGVREWREISALAKAIERVCTEWRPDILHAHSPALCGHAALKASKALNIPLVYEIRAFWEDAAVGNGTGSEGSLKYRMTRALENRVIAGADAVFTICEGLRNDLIERGFNGGKIGVSPNGVDLALFGDPPARDDALAEGLGLNEPPVIGFIGSFYDYEGLDDLIAAMPALQNKQPGTQLLLVGGGPCDDALRVQAAASPAARAIHFTGRVPHSEVERYYSLIDVLAYPRKRSRLTDLVTPLKPLEAMAQRRIVAASDVGGHRELIADGVSGVLMPADNPQGIATALSDLIDNRGDWPTMKERARDHVEANHDWAQNIYRYQSVYHHLLARAPNGDLTAAA